MSPADATVYRLGKLCNALGQRWHRRHCAWCAEPYQHRFTLPERRTLNRTLRHSDPSGMRIPCECQSPICPDQ